MKKIFKIILFLPNTEYEISFKRIPWLTFTFFPKDAPI